MQDQADIKIVNTIDFAGRNSRQPHHRVQLVVGLLAIHDENDEPIYDLGSHFLRINSRI